LPTIRVTKRRKTSDLFGRGLEILFSAKTTSLRAVSVLSLTGALVNALYSIYVLIVSLGGGVAEGWSSMSLQISGMFFLTSLTLAAICEFLIFLYNTSLTDSRYFISRELSSRRSGLSKKLNIVEHLDSD
jgi:hypothetical protein